MPARPPAAAGICVLGGRSVGLDVGAAIGEQLGELLLQAGGLALVAIGAGWGLLTALDLARMAWRRR